VFTLAKRFDDEGEVEEAEEGERSTQQLEERRSRLRQEQ
jgi:hypothetical protein